MIRTRHQLLAATLVVAACGGPVIVVGDDTILATEPVPNGLGAAQQGDGGAAFPTPVDAEPPTDFGFSDASAPKDARADVECPLAIPLDPGRTDPCDGGPIAPLYTPSGCAAGYACGPVACTEAGATCVSLASPGACPSGRFGESSRYTCGAGAGCCLP
jgi:hypothetical protein